MAQVITLYPHAVHVPEPHFELDSAKVQTYDPDRAPKQAKPDGEDITPAKKIMRLIDDGSLEVVDVPEVRTPYWLIDNPTRRYVGPDNCPDCGGGLSSRGYDFVCIRVADEARAQGRVVELKGDHEGCMVACGIEIETVPD